MVYLVPPCDVLYFKCCWLHHSCRVGSDHLPLRGWSRTLLASWWLLAIVMSASYSCNLVAFLSTTKETRPFTSLTELVQQDVYNWGMLGGSFTANIFKVTWSPKMYSFNIISKARIFITDKHIIKLKHQTICLQYKQNNTFVTLAPVPRNMMVKTKTF